MILIFLQITLVRPAHAGPLEEGAAAISVVKEGLDAAADLLDSGWLDDLLADDVLGDRMLADDVAGNRMQPRR